MCRSLAVLLFCVLALGGTPAAASSAWERLADPVFVHVDTRELPEAAVMALAQDRVGFLWVGTQGGLARFDGYHVRSFLPSATDPDALPDGYVRALVADGDRGLWIGASSSGLVHYDGATERFRTWRPSARARTGPRSAAVNALLAGPGGRLWVGGDGGLDTFDPRAGRFTATALVAHGAQPVVWTLLRDRAGALWAGTQAGLYVRPAGAAHFRAFALRTAGAPAIYSLCEDGAGRVWAGAVNALYAIDRTRRSSVAYVSSATDSATLAPGQQWAIAEMRPGVVWAGTDSAISIVDTATHTVRRIAADRENPGGLTGGRVLQFFRDRSGFVWLANHVGGLLSYHPGGRGLYELSSTRPEIGFGSEGAVAVVADGGRLWVGGFAGRIAAFDPRTTRPFVVTLPNRAAVQTLLVAHDGTLWAGTTSGICRLPRGARRATCPAAPRELAGASIYAFVLEGTHLWVGSSAGLMRLDTATNAVTTIPATRLTNSQVRALVRDRAGRLWIGTENGLNRLDRDGRIVRFAFDPADANTIGPGGITSIIEDRRGRIWAGVTGGPTDVFEPLPGGALRVRRIDRDAGLPHQNVDALAEDARGRIWASTDHGIGLIDPQTFTARGLGFSDGVSEGAFWAGTVAQAADGTIFFGGLHGVTIVAPDAAPPARGASTIVVTALEVGRRNVPAWDVERGGGTVTLPPDARDISVEFAALDAPASDAVRFAYRLAGFDRDWIAADARHRVATYRRLPPGDYTLLIRSANGRGAWDDRMLRIGVRAAPAWFETWWFRVLLAVVLALGLLGAHVLRTALLRRRQHELEATVTARTAELSEANAKLEELSLSDPLTGLRNRRFLAPHLEPDVAMTVRRYGDRRAGAGDPPDADILFFVIDLDHLKIVNDRFGHHAGDAVLVQMRDRLHEVFRETDFVLRWGGDEFLAVARGSRRSDAAAIAERLRQTVAGRPFAVGGSGSIDGSVSIGFATFPFLPATPGAVTWPHVIALADQALYLAKQAGRNTWCGLEPSERTDRETLLRELEHSAEEAVQAGELVRIQPGVTDAASSIRGK